MSQDKEQTFHCAACGRDFVATPQDVSDAGGHLCIAAERGLSQAEGLKEIRGGIESLRK
jgi:hypothetical protein